MIEPRERPLNCTAFEVRAFLAGAKTQIRRPIMPQLVVPDERPLRHARKHPGPYFDAYCGERKTAHNPRGMSDRWCWWTADDRPILPEIQCPFGQPGDRLWLRESFALRTDVVATDLAKALRYIRYRADRDGADLRSEWHNFGSGWRSLTTMPRWASRLTLEVVNVRVQRAQEISDDNARSEGVEMFDPTTVYASLAVCSRSARTWFSALWDSTNGKRAPWSNNPWVWAATVRMADQRTS